MTTKLEREYARGDRLEAELATLKRELEQLRAAVTCYLSALDEPMSNEAAQRITNTEIRLRTIMAAHDATRAEPVRERITVRTDHTPVMLSQCTPDPEPVREPFDPIAVRDSERRADKAQAEIERLKACYDEESGRLLDTRTKLLDLRTFAKTLRAAAKSVLTSVELETLDAAIEASE